MDEATTYPVPADLAGRSAFYLPVRLTAPLSDRLEVPEEWQAHESFNVRLANTLDSARRALAASPSSKASSVPFEVQLRSYATGHLEMVPMVLELDSFGVLLGLRS